MAHRSEAGDDEDPRVLHLRGHQGGRVALGYAGRGATSLRREERKRSVKRRTRGSSGCFAVHSARAARTDRRDRTCLSARWGRVGRSRSPHRLSAEPLPTLPALLGGEPPPSPPAVSRLLLQRRSICWHVTTSRGVRRSGGGRLLRSLAQQRGGRNSWHLIAPNSARRHTDARGLSNSFVSVSHWRRPSFSG